MWQLGTPALELVARTVIVYVMFFAALRLFGKRELGQFTLFDVAVVFLAANALQPAITGPDSSIPGAAIILTTMFLLTAGVSQIRRRFPRLRFLVQFQPTVIGQDGRWLDRAVDREGLDDVDLEAALRGRGLESVAEVKLATLEEDGSISIIPFDEDEDVARKRRRRYRRHR